MPGPSLGTNLSGLADWATNYPFVNQFLMTRDWFTQSSTQWNSNQAHLLELDENGWVRAFTADGSPAPFQSVATIWQTNGSTFRPGIYVLDWQGQGSITVAGAEVLSSANGKITFRLSGPDAVGFNITATDPAGTGDYIRDIRLYHRDDADLIEAGMIFNPAFLERIEDFRTLRFMDWGATNNSSVNGVEDLRPFDAARQTGEGGASLDIMVELANQTRADPWFCFPHLADDAYVRAYATYVRDHLDPGLVARFEFSNEVWNWSFQQAQHAQAQAVALWGANVEGGWMQWYGMRASQIAEIVAEVFGTETGSRALNVFSTQAGWQGVEGYALNAPNAVADGEIAAKDAPFHVYAIAPYFGGAVGHAENGALIDQWLTMGEQGYRAAIAYIRGSAGFDSLGQIGATVAYHATIAQSLGWQLEAYEGGQHVVDMDGLFGGAQDPAQTEFFINLVKRPEFRALYTEYFDIWQANGGGLMAQFSDISMPSRYGSWGIWDSVFSPDTPRALAVQAYRDGVEAWWADDRTASTFADGKTLIDIGATHSQSGSSRDDHLFGLAGADTAFGYGGDDLIHTGSGNDIAYGSSGDDTMLGGKGADSLLGGKGADRISGGKNRDTLTGNSGEDVFVFTAGDGIDRITDFSIRHDSLELDASLYTPGSTAAMIVASHARVTSTGVLLAFEDGTRILLQGLTTTTGLADTLLLG